MPDTDLEYTPITDPLPRMVTRAELDTLRRERDVLVAMSATFDATRHSLLADLERCLDYLRTIGSGAFTVQLLASLPDVVEEIAERWGLGA